MKTYYIIDMGYWRLYYGDPTRNYLYSKPLGRYGTKWGAKRAAKRLMQEFPDGPPDDPSARIIK